MPALVRPLTPSSRKLLRRNRPWAFVCISACVRRTISLALSVSTSRRPARVAPDQRIKLLRLLHPRRCHPGYRPLRDATCGNSAIPAPALSTAFNSRVRALPEFESESRRRRSLSLRPLAFGEHPASIFFGMSAPSAVPRTRVRQVVRRGRPQSTFEQVRNRVPWW